MVAILGGQAGVQPKRAGCQHPEEGRLGVDVPHDLLVARLEQSREGHTHYPQLHDLFVEIVLADADGVDPKLQGLGGPEAGESLVELLPNGDRSPVDTDGMLDLCWRARCVGEGGKAAIFYCLIERETDEGTGDGRGWLLGGKKW